MVLDNFRTIELIWDRANKSIIKTIKTASSDENGRYFSVKVLDDGQEVDLTGAKLQLYWEHPNFNTRGTDNFTTVDTKGKFTLTFSKEMLTNIGELTAYLILTLSDGKITSDGFAIEVIKGAESGVVIPSNGDNLAIEAVKDATEKLTAIEAASGVAIISDNSITSRKIAESAVTPSKTEHLVKNILNPETTIFPHVLNSDGTVTENASGYYVSDFVPVMPSRTYWLTRSRVNILMVQYDVNKNFLSYVNGTGTNGTNDPYKYQPANPNVRYVRLQYSRYVDTPETFMMIEGQYYPDTFVPFESYYAENMYYNKLKLPTYKPLDAQKIAFVGDSITAADGTTPTYASETVKGYQSYVKELGADVTSLHYAGATYRKYDANISDSTHPSLYTAIILNNEWDFSSYDTVCLMAGTNDVGRGPNFGTVNSRDSGTTFGALNLIIEYIIQANPNVKIILFTPPQRKREGTTHVPDLWSKLLELCDGFEEIGANYGVKTVNLVKEGGIGFANLNSTLYDVVHPNYLGHELISKAIVANL